MKFETKAIHEGYTPEKTTNSCAVPIYRTSAYTFNSAEHAQNLFSLKELGNIYSRLTNPTVEVLEKRLAALEGGAAAVATASGTAAIHYAIINICQSGDEIVSANNLYGGTYTMFDVILKQFGITAHLTDPTPESFEKKINEKTRALYIETIGNPALDVTNIAAFSALAKKYELPLIVDSTFTPPCLLKPIEHGADIVCHSLTKWIGGHGTGIGGIVIDSGKFNWKNEKFALYNEPDESYHGLRYAHDLGELSPVAFAIRLRIVPLRNLGACLSPDNAWLFLQGIETLALRMERHCSNALAVATYLENHPKVSWVKYPGLKSHPSYELAKKQLPNGTGGAVVFGITGGLDAGKSFIEKLNLFSHCANVGDAKSLAIHPASTTHSQLSEQQQADGGISPELVRLSIGIEHIDDIIQDLEQAL